MTGWIGETTLAVSLLILAVLALRGPVARRFGAHAAYALWAAPALRLVIPPLDVLPHFFPQAASADMWIELSSSDAATASNQTGAFPWLVVLWAAGAILFLAAQLVRHARFVAAARRDSRTIGHAGPVRIVASPAVSGPLATGLVDRLILVPEDFDARFGPRERELALLHERLHHQRLDLWAAGASLLLASALWFNPLVHAAMLAFRRDMEASCDASVLALAGPDARGDYAETLLRSACPRVPRTLCALTSIEDLKGRLTMLDQSMTGLRRAGGLILAATVAAAGLTLAAPAATVASADPAKPTPPAPPAPPATMEGKYMIVKVDKDGTANGTFQVDKQVTNDPVRKEVRIVEIHGKDGKELKWTDKDGGIHKPDCGGTPTEVSANTEANGQKQQARIVICNRGDVPKAEQVKHLEEAIDRLRGSSEMDAAVRADLVAKLQAKVAELKARP